MGSLTNFGESALVKHIITEAAYSPATTLYLALCTADPTDAATGASMNEVANAEAYARVAIAFSAAATRRITQTGAVTFATATGVGWGTASHWAIVDSITYGAGNVLAAGAFATPKAIVSGNTPSVATTETDPGALDLVVDRLDAEPLLPLALALELPLNSLPLLPRISLSNQVAVNLGRHVAEVDLARADHENLVNPTSRQYDAIGPEGPSLELARMICTSLSGSMSGFAAFRAS